VSEDVQQAATDPGVDFVDLGPVELKGVLRPVRFFKAHGRA